MYAYKFWLKKKIILILLIFCCFVRASETSKSITNQSQKYEFNNMNLYTNKY